MGNLQLTHGVLQSTTTIAPLSNENVNDLATTFNHTAKRVSRPLKAQIRTHFFNAKIGFHPGMLNLVMKHS